MPKFWLSLFQAIEIVNRYNEKYCGNWLDDSQMVFPILEYNDIASMPSVGLSQRLFLRSKEDVSFE